MKREAQVRDLLAARNQDLSGGERILLSPEQIRAAKVKWPKQTT
jgi:hypothetical protein